MSKAIIYLAFLIVLATIANGRVLEKRSPVADGEFDDLIDGIGDVVGDWVEDNQDKIEEHLDNALDSVSDWFGKKKRSPGIGDHIDAAIDKV